MRQVFNLQISHHSYQVIPTPLPPLPGTPIPEQDKDDGKLITPIIDPTAQRPNHTGHDDGISDIDIKNDTGGNQILDKDWRDYILTADNKITRSDQAEIRNSEGRPVGQVVNDIENSRPSDILVQDDGRWVILGPKGRVHILEPNGEVVTSIENDRKNTLNRIKDGRWERSNNDKL